jgi:hypothetical protein
MLKDKRACGFEEVSKPSIGIYTKEEETVKKKKKQAGVWLDVPNPVIHDTFRIKGQTW